ncbi:hypothetical protein WJX72_006285 [[Myrmecia] bisecta]|uniref:Uncharacterized protein n=1 Tax=[Myrmecia] bisecta TaxID=41462 RepID=A0AAW1R7J1_9CHLO
MTGGPALADFAPFPGVNYIRSNMLPGGTIQIADSALDIKDSVFNMLRALGQATIILNNTVVTISNSTFTNNRQAAVGGVLGVGTSKLTVTDSRFEGNVGGQAGGVSILTNSTLVLNGTVFDSNQGAQGGAVAVTNSTSALISACTFTNNTGSNGGAIYINNVVGGDVLLYANNFTSNGAVFSGGALFQQQADGELIDNVFSENLAAGGGAVWQSSCKSINHFNNLFDSNVAKNGSTLEMNTITGAIQQTTFSNNRGLKGAALYTAISDVAVTGCIFDSNAAAQQGGAVYRVASSGDISSCAFDSNTARQQAGAIYDTQVTGDINMCSFDSNKAGTKPQGIYRLESTGSINSPKGLADQDVQTISKSQEGSDPSAAGGVVSDVPSGVVSDVPPVSTDLPVASDSPVASDGSTSPVGGSGGGGVQTLPTSSGRR